MRAASPALMVTPRTREGRTVVSREVSPARVLPPVFIKTQTGAVVTQVTQEIDGVRRVTKLNPRLPPAPVSVQSPYAVPGHVPARSGLPFATPPRVRAADLHARAASSQRFETPPKVARPPPWSSSPLEPSPGTSEPRSLPTLLAAKAIGQDALVLASKEPKPTRPTEQASSSETTTCEDAPALRPANVLVLQEQQDDQAAPAKEPPSEKQRCLEAATENHAKTMQERTEDQEATLEATMRMHAQILQEQREHYESMLEELKEVQKATLEAALRAHAQTLQEQREQHEAMLEEFKEVQKATLEAALQAHAQSLQEQRQQHEGMLEELKEVQEATLEAALRTHAQILQEQREQHEGMLEVEHRRAEQAEAKLAMAETAQEEEQREIQEVALEAARRIHAQNLQEQREQHEGMLEEQKEIQEAALEAARRIHAQNLQEQREQHEGMFEVERLRAELERDRCQQAEEKCALALQLQEQALATVKTVSEVHEKKLEEMQASYRKQLSMERNSRLQAEAELRKLQAELEKFSMVSISDSELATEAETAPAQASSSSSTPPDAQPHTAETQPSFRATSSVRQIAEMPPAGQMPRGDYRAITCWQEAGVYGKKPEELRAGRAAEDGTSEQEQAERVQEVRTLYRAKHGPYSKPNATQLVEFARTACKSIKFKWVREEVPKP